MDVGPACQPRSPLVFPVGAEPHFPCMEQFPHWTSLEPFPQSNKLYLLGLQMPLGLLQRAVLQHGFPSALDGFISVLRGHQLCMFFAYSFLLKLRVHILVLVVLIMSVSHFKVDIW